MIRSAADSENKAWLIRWSNGVIQSFYGSREECAAYAKRESEVKKMEYMII